MQRFLNGIMGDILRPNSTGGLPIASERPDLTQALHPHRLVNTK